MAGLTRFCGAVMSVLMLLAGSVFSQEPAPRQAGTPSRPNVVLIMADDVGWEAFGCYGGTDYQTPNLDALCDKGVRFSHCYSTPLCTPSRVQIMTGKYNFRNYTHFGYLNPAEHTFGQMMRGAGYATAIAGKWQLNGLANQLPGYDDNTRPDHFGFDEYLLWQLTKSKSISEGGGERFWSPVLEHNGRLLSIEDNQDQYGPDMMCDFICDFVDRHQQQPFFVYYPMMLVHDPFVPTPDTIGDRDRGHATNKAVAREKQENFGAMLNYMDKIVGRIVDKVEALGQLENTLIVFTSDNGTHRSIRSLWQNKTIQGGKGLTTDMGTHVPLVAYWKGRTPSGVVVDDLVDFTDFYATLADLIGADAKASDGRSFLPQLRGQPGNPRDWILCHYQPFWSPAHGQFARTQTYKLYRDGRFYEVPSDLEESRDLTSGTAEAESDRIMLSTILQRTPPVPEGIGNDDLHDRAIYPQWPKIGLEDAANADPQEFRILFNGTSLEGWKHSGNWRIEEGVLTRTDRGGDCVYVDEKIPDDFELRFQWKVAPGSNSGVYYRPGQYEYQILDNASHPDGKNPRTSAASLYFCMAPSHDVTREVGQWNTARIICQGTRIQHWLNGQKVIDFDYSDPAYEQNVELLSQRGGELSARGAHLSLQDHGDPVWYRHIFLRERAADEPLDNATLTPAVIPQAVLEAERKKLDAIISRRQTPK